MSTTPEPADLSPVTVRVTHPFHPRFGQELEFVKRLVTWRVDRVFFFDEAGALGSLPAEWTDLAPPDGFVVVAHGRGAVSDLCPVGAGRPPGHPASQGVSTQWRGCPGDYAMSVKKIMTSWCRLPTKLFLAWTTDVLLLLRCSRVFSRRVPARCDMGVRLAAIKLCESPAARRPPSSPRRPPARGSTSPEVRTLLSGHYDASGCDRAGFTSKGSSLGRRRRCLLT